MKWLISITVKFTFYWPYKVWPCTFYLRGVIHISSSSEDPWFCASGVLNMQNFPWIPLSITPCWCLSILSAGILGGPAPLPWPSHQPQPMQNTPVCRAVAAAALCLAGAHLPVLTVEITPCPGIPGKQGSSSGPGKLALPSRSGGGCDSVN